MVWLSNHLDKSLAVQLPDALPDFCECRKDPQNILQADIDNFDLRNEREIHVVKQPRRRKCFDE